MLYRDSRLAVIDKPAGMPCHPTRSEPDGISVESLFPALFGPSRQGPFLAHRLDRDTSGCLVIALRRSALRELQPLFAERLVAKTYWAAVLGDPGERGTIRSNLARVENGRKWRIAERRDGDPAVTDWIRLATDGGRSVLELRPRTGRTHQLRVHCASLGAPILGDRVYGDARDTAPLHLHARAIRIPLDPEIRAEAPLPPHMRAAFASLGLPEA